MNCSYIQRQRGPKVSPELLCPCSALTATPSSSPLLHSSTPTSARSLGWIPGLHASLCKLPQPPVKDLYNSPQGIISHIPSPEPLSQLSAFRVAGSVSSSGQDRHSTSHHGLWMVERSFIALSQGPAGQCDWRLCALDPSTEHTSLATGGINESA